MDSDARPWLLPREAFRFWPDESVAMRGTGRFAQRLIFRRQEFSDSEEEAISRLVARMDCDEKLSCRLLGKLERTDLLRFVYAAEWDMERAVEKIRKHLQWLETKLVTVRNSSIAAFQTVLVLLTQASGGFYTHGRDCFYRPLLILTPSKLHSVRTIQFPLDLIVSTVIFVLDFVERNMLLPGQIENWMLLVNFEDTSELLWPTIQEMRTIFDVFHTGFPCRLAGGLIWRVNRSLWARVTVVLSPETSGKFTLLTDPSEVMKTVSRSQLEMRFGGCAEDRTVFWPPENPKNCQFATEVEVPLGEYSSYQEYFPERSVSFDEIPSQEENPAILGFHCSAADTPMTQTEEGPTITAPVRVHERSINFSRSEELPKREITTTVVEGNEGIGFGCTCYRQQNSDCKLL